MHTVSWYPLMFAMLKRTDAVEAPERYVKLEDAPFEPADCETVVSPVPPMVAVAPLPLFSDQTPAL